MRVLRWLPLALVAVLAVVAAGTLLASTFMAYDDEGYVLFSLRTFCETGSLYDKTFSQYGPFYFLVYQALHFAGFAFTTFDGRMVTLVMWMATAGLCASLVWRLTRSRAATLFTLGGVTAHLWPLSLEPSHPGGLIALLVAFAAWAGCRWSSQPPRLALVAGIVGAALLLTKINVGVFLLFSAGSWWASHLALPAAAARWRAALLGIAHALVPLLLMRGHFDRTPAIAFACASAVAGVTTALAAARHAEPIARWRDLRHFAAGFAATLALVVGGVLLQGTSAPNLLEGVLLGPLRHPKVYAFFRSWDAVALGAAALHLALGLWLTLSRPAWAGRFIVIARWAQAAALAVALAGLLRRESDSFSFLYLMSGVWVHVYPARGDDPGFGARAWLALLLVTQLLHAYPVAGSQISWGTFLIVPLTAVAIHALVAQHSHALLPRFAWTMPVAAALLTAGTVARCAQLAWTGATRIAEGNKLGLPGTLLYLPEDGSTAMRMLARNTTAHANLLFTVPGLLSFHLWTDVPPPTTQNATHWFSLLSGAQQEEIRAKLEANPRACIIVQRYLLDFLKQEKIAVETPLNAWIAENYEPAFKVDTYEFLVRKGRSIAPLGAATLHFSEQGRAGPKQVKITLGSPEPLNIHSIEVRQIIDHRSTTREVWDNSNVELFTTPLTPTGAVAGPPTHVRFPLTVTGITRLEVIMERFPELAGPGILVLRDAENRRVGEARFVR